MNTFEPNARELATILAALRLWRSLTAPTRDRAFAREHFVECTPLDDAEIDDLCERLNGRAPPSLEQTLAALLASNDRADLVGRALVDLLQLRTRRDNGRIDTAIGDKTPAGVARIVARWLAENIERDNGRDAA